MEYKDNLLGVVETIFKWKKIIVLTCLATGIGAIITVLVLPVYYESTTVFYAASPDLATPESIFGGSSIAPDYYGTGNDTERLITIAESGELVTHMVEKFNLYERYDIDPDEPLGAYNVRLKFNTHYDVIKTKYDAVELSMEDEEKEIAAEMANAARDYIANSSVQLVKNSQKKLLTIFQQNLKSKQSQLDSLNKQLLNVRKKFGVYNTDAQSESLSELLAKAESRLYNSQAKLESLRNTGGRRDTINLLVANIKGYENEIEKLGERIEVFNNGMAKVEMLQNIQEETSKILAEDREHFKQIQAAYQTDFPSIMLVEAAPIPIVKSRPKRTLIVVASVMLAFIFSVIGILIIDTYKDVDWKKITQLDKW
ncbi:MAG: hypothetical protein AAFZ15_25995 [Bacteroidota bacterium]